MFIWSCSGFGPFLLSGFQNCTSCVCTSLHKTLCLYHHYDLAMSVYSYMLWRGSPKLDGETQPDCPPKIYFILAIICITDCLTGWTWLVLNHVSLNMPINWVTKASAFLVLGGWSEFDSVSLSCLSVLGCCFIQHIVLLSFPTSVLVGIKKASLVPWSGHGKHLKGRLLSAAFERASLKNSTTKPLSPLAAYPLPSVDVITIIFFRFS